jgi:hypothetical protein
MKYRRGLFRLWLAVTAVALIGAPIWLLSEGMRLADHTCFKITELHLKNPKSALAGEPLPMTICTDPDLFDDPNRRALERGWADIESLKVEYDHNPRDVETFTPTSKTGDTDLYVRAELRFQRAVFLDLLKDQVPALEGVVIVLAVVVWWVGRLVAAVANWVRRGFAVPR